MSRTLLFSMVSLTAAGALAYMYLPSSEEADDNKLPALTAEITEEILHALNDKVKELAMKSVRTAEAVKQKFAAQGQQPDDAQLREHLIIPQFLKDFEGAQNEVFRTFDVDADELEEAVEWYSKEGTGDVVKLSKAIQDIYRSIGGKIEAPSTSTAVAGGNGTANAGKKLNLDECLMLLGNLANILNAKTDEYITNFKAEFGMPQDQGAFQRFQMGMVQLSEITEKQILTQCGVTEGQFRDALMSHNKEPALAEAMMLLQQQSQMILQKHGMMMMPQM